MSSTLVATIISFPVEEGAGLLLEATIDISVSAATSLLLVWQLWGYKTSSHNTSMTQVQTPQAKHVRIFWRHLRCWFFRCGQLSIRKGNHLPETDCCWAGLALKQQNESTKGAKFKAKNWELKTTGVNCLASCHTGSLSCSGSPDLMCKIDISVLSIFLCQFILPCGAKSAFFCRQLNILPPQNLELNLIFLMGM